MKKCKTHIITVLFMLLSLSCSKHSQKVVAPKATDLGRIEVVDGVSSSHLLADGRTCELMPIILPGGHQIQLEASIKNTNAAGTKHVISTTSYITPNEATTFMLDSNDVISLTLHVKD